MTGSAYACNLVVESAAFRWTAGQDALRRYDLPQARSFANEFCSVCGSSVPHHTRSRREVVVLTGTLDDDPGLRSPSDLHLDERPAWVQPDPSLRPRGGGEVSAPGLPRGAR